MLKHTLAKPKSKFTESMKFKLACDAYRRHCQRREFRFQKVDSGEVVKYRAGNGHERFGVCLLINETLVCVVDEGTGDVIGNPKITSYEVTS